MEPTTIIIIGTLILTLVVLIDILIRLGIIPAFSKQIKAQKDEKKQLKAIRKITSTFSQEESFDTIINAIIQIAIESLNAEIGSILLYNEDLKGLVIAASEGLDKSIQNTTVINNEDNISWWVFKHQEPLLIKDLTRDTRFSYSTGNPIYKGKSIMCVPIRTGEANLGVCCITNPLDGKPFTEESLTTLKSIGGQIAIIVDNEIHHQDLFTRMNEIEMLYNLSEQISHSLNLKDTLQNIVQLATDITRTDACSLRLLNPDRNELEIMGCVGVSPEYEKKGALKVGDGVGGYVAQEGIAVTIPNLKKDKRVTYTSYLENEGLMSLVSVPIIMEGEGVIGIISVYKKSEYEFSQETVNLLSTFANHTAVAIKNAHLFESLQQNYYDTIQSLALALEARDKYTRGHSERVTDYSIQIAKEMGIHEGDIDILRFAGRLHDIGKIAISDNILLKAGKLTIAEYADIKTHPLKGAELLNPLHFLDHAIPLIKHHHERFDGKGYPDGLADEKIPLLARILTVADAFDAMASERPYRAPLPQDEALGEIVRNKGTQFDPKVVEAFEKIVNGGR